MHLFVSLILVWICSWGNCQDEGDRFIWLPLTPVAVGGSGNDGVISSELGEGESVTIKASLMGDNDRPQQTEEDEQMTNPPRHERVHVTTRSTPTQVIDKNDLQQVHVQEWLPTSTEANDDLINRANEVSAPWYDVMLAGLPPAVAYDWRFLVDMSDKLKTAPRNSYQSLSDRAVYKYLLKRVIQSTTPNAAKFDVLKHNHQLKAKMQQSNDNYAFNWAWKRTQPLQ